MPTSAPDATELAVAFDLGAASAPAEWVASGWGAHNQLWRLTTGRGRWAIKRVGRDLSLDPDDTLALELAAYAGGVPMPRPIPTTAGRCFAVLDGGRYRCHEWIDGLALPWHGHAPATAAAVGGVLASLHGLRLPWWSHLAPQRPSHGMTRWLALAESTRSFDTSLRISLDRALPSVALNRVACHRYRVVGPGAFVPASQHLRATAGP